MSERAQTMDPETEAAIKLAVREHVVDTPECWEVHEKCPTDSSCSLYGSLRALARTVQAIAVKAERDACCEAACRGCREGKPFDGPRWHLFGMEIQPCHAYNIRALRNPEPPDEKEKLNG